jgi:hypothetical protein
MRIGDFYPIASDLMAEESRSIFDSCFSTFPWNALPPQSTGTDVACGSGC